MLRLSFRSILAHKLRFLLTTLAVVTGVAFIVGAFVVTDSLRASVNDLFANINKGVDVSVRASTPIGGGTSVGLSRGRVSGDLVDVVRQVDGVAVAEGTIGGYAQVLDKNGEPLKTTGAPFLGVSWGKDDSLYPVKLEDGHKPVGPNEVAIDRASAQDAGLTVGDHTKVLLLDGTQRDVTVVGIFTFGEANNLLGARLTAFDASVAQEVFGGPGQFDSIDVRAQPGIAPADLANRIQSVLPAGTEAVTASTVRQEGENTVGGFLDVFQNILLGFAAVAVFVAAFYINNTFSIVLLGQRTRELALLRAIGATPGQVTRSVMLEATIIGATGLAFGVAFGLVIAHVLRAILSAGGFDVPSNSLVLLGRTWGAAVLVGIGVTVVAAAVPARRAARIPPIEGLREGYVVHHVSRARRTALATCVIAAGGLLVFLGLFVADGAMPILLTLGLGAIMVFLGVAQLSPVVAVPVTRILGRIVGAPFRQAGRLGRANTTRNPYRTAKTAAALMIGLALVTAVFVIGTSIKKTFASSIDKAVKADFIVSTDTNTGYSPQLTAALAALSELESVTGVRFDRLLFNGHERDVVAVDPVPSAAVVDIGVQSGSLADLGPGSIFIQKDPAKDLGLKAGDTVQVQFASGGPQQLRVAGIYSDATWAGNYLIDLATFERYYPANQLDMFTFARVAPGVDAANAKAAIEAALAPYPQVKLEDRAEFKASQEAQLNGLLIAVNGLLALALFIALMGIANTLALSVLERTREIGLLRAVGMLRRQVRQMVLTEAITVALFGAVLGVAVGMLFGIATASALPASAVKTIAVPAGTLVGIVVASAIFGTLAGLLPARRAARLDVLKAIASE